MSELPRAAFVSSSGAGADDLFRRVYPENLRQRLRRVCQLVDAVLTPDQLLTRPEVQWLFSTWGMPALTPEQLDRLPHLRAVFYGAGSVQGFARPLLERDIKVVSAWAANAVPVAEFTLAQILLACRRVWPHALQLREQKSPAAWKVQGACGAFGTRVALIALGMVGRRVAELLRPFDLQVLGYDPYVNDETFTRLRLQRASLEECFETAEVVSIHLPNLPATKHLIGRGLLQRLRPNATLINTARGGVLDAQALFDVLRARPDVTAFIDVTDPTEPPPAGSPYYDLPNLILTPHIAGALGNELARMGLFIAEEAERLARGESLHYAVTLKMLEMMA